MVSAWFRLASETCLYKSCRTSGDSPASMEGPLGIFEKSDRYYRCRYDISNR